MDTTNQGSALELAHQHAVQYVGELGHVRVGATASFQTLHSRLAGPLPESGEPPAVVLRRLIADSRGGLHASTSGRFFAWVIGGGLESALAADWLTATWDQNAALVACGPFVAVAEQVAGEWLKELLGLPSEASYAFTTGCQLAHVTCLAAARHELLRKAGWDVESQGLAGSPQVRVITSDQKHASVDRAVRLLGLGSNSIVAVPTDDDGAISVEAFDRALDATTGPRVVVLNAADLNVGAFDDFATLIPRSRQAGAWVHIDGAFGLFARASESKRALTNGVELADSWATDAHKWLNVPFDCGFAVVRHAEAHRASMTGSGSYLATSCEGRDQINWNPEWSRRARGVPVYAALRELGRNGVRDLVERSCRLASMIVDGLGGLDGVQVLWRPTLNQGLVRFLDPRPDATANDHDRHTDAVIRSINADGVAFFSGTTWRGRRAMRVSVVNWRTNQGDVEAAVESVRRVLVALNGSAGRRRIDRLGE